MPPITGVALKDSFRCVNGKEMIRDQGSGVSGFNE
jgi:hypothetical protein